MARDRNGSSRPQLPAAADVVSLATSTEDSIEQERDLVIWV
jgi:hypothetical protein